MTEETKPQKSGAGAESKAVPEKVHVAQQWKHSSPLISCRFDPSGRFVFAGAQDNSVQRWELASGKRTAFEAHRSWVRGIAFSRQGETMITGGYEGDLIWWDASAESPKTLRRVRAHDGWVRAVAVSPDGRWLASVGNDHLLKTWSLETGELVREFRGHDCHVYNVAFHPDGRHVVSADLKGGIKQWELESGKHVRDLECRVLYKYDKGFRADIGGARGMAFNADGSRLACSGITNVTNAFAGVGNPMVVVLDWQKGGIMQKHVAKKKYNGVAWGVVFHPQDFIIGVSGGGGGGFLLFWRAAQAEEFFQYKLPNTARDLDLHRDHLRLATAHYDGHIRIAEMRAKAKG